MDSSLISLYWPLPLTQTIERGSRAHVLVKAKGKGKDPPSRFSQCPSHLRVSPLPGHPFLSAGCGPFSDLWLCLSQMYEIKSGGSIAKKFNEILQKLSSPLKPRVPEHSNNRMKNLSYPFSREKMYL